MARKTSKRHPASTTGSSAGVTKVYSHVGNPGCIRFPPAIRKTTGIKRGDRLHVTLQGEESILLTRVVDEEAQAADLEVEACACQSPPAGCWQGESGSGPAGLVGVVTVGWSYVQLPLDFARAHGFLADRPISLVGEHAQVAVQCLQEFPEQVTVTAITCPP